MSSSKAWLAAIAFSKGLRTAATEWSAEKTQSGPVPLMPEATPVDLLSHSPT